jgi:conjugative relaxase-like TrwC/TraI family protein
VLRIAKMAPARWRYYAGQVALGLEDYYARGGEEPGRWCGRGTAVLGLVGRVQTPELAQLFGEGRHPQTGEGLGRTWSADDEGVVAGYSLSLSAPKSVSLLWALGGVAESVAVRAAHDAAVGSVVAYLDEHAAFSRAGKGGVFSVDTDGLAVAAFVHRTSRALDPQLHTHLLVSAKVRRADGEWRALDGRDLYGQQKAASGLYQAALRAELAQRLGVAWEEPGPHGHADLVGVPAELRRSFSARRAEVEAEAARRVAAAEASRGRPLSPPERAEAYQQAAYATRAPKGAEDHTTAQLRARWLVEARAAGHAPEAWLGGVLGREQEPPELDPERLGAEVVATLAEERSTWGRAEVVAAVARRLPPGLVGSAEAARAWVEEMADAVLARAEIVRLEAPPTAVVPEGLRRRDGLGTHERHGSARYTTRATLALEAQVCEFARRGREAAIALVPSHVVEGAIVRVGLDDDQAVLVRRLCGGGEALVCVVGPAGAGKTRSLRVAAAAWSSAGIPLRGLAPTASAAGVLGEEAGIPSETVAKFCWEQAGGRPAPPWRLSAGEVVVVDEAAQLATADLARLVWAAKGAGAKVVLVGDHRQLGAVGAGGLFRLLVAETERAELDGVRRFAEEWEAEASLPLRAGDPAVVGGYARRGRVAGGGRGEALDAAFGAWCEAQVAGHSVLIMADDHETVDALARRARALRVMFGEVAPEGIAVGEQTVGVGDEVVTTRNDRRLATSRRAWVRNGDRWVVEAVEADGSLVASHTRGRGRVRLPAEYVAEHVALAYAVTVHKAQGVTVERGILVADEATGAEAVYVGMTRGRLSNHAFVVCEPAGHVHDREHPPTPAEVLARAVTSPRAERSATEVLRDELARADDLAFLMPLLLQARAHMGMTP